MPTQRCKEKRVGERASTWERETWPFGSSFYMFFPPPGPALCKSGQPGVLFGLPEVLTQVLGPSSVLFLQAFLFLVFWPPQFWTPLSYSNYLTFPLKRWEAQFFGNRGVEVFLATSC